MRVCSVPCVPVIPHCHEQDIQLVFRVGRQRSERMGLDVFIRSLFTRSSRHWRIRALRARAAFEHERWHPDDGVHPSPAPVPRFRNSLHSIQRTIKHSTLVGLVAAALLSDPLVQHSVPLQPDQPARDSLILDQPLSLAIAPLPLAVGPTDAQSLQTVAPRLSEPVVPTALFQAQHVLAEGETLGAIARQYAIPLEALIWANRLERGDALIAGQVLQIPRMAGVVHAVQPGETLSTVATVYGVTPEAIFGFAPNRLDEDDLIALPIGAEIFIPGGTRSLPENLLGSYGGLEGLAERGSEAAGIVLADETNVRDGPSTEHRRVFQLSAGRQVALLARYQDWLFVGLGAQQGWLRSDLIAVDPALIATLAEKTDFPEPPPRWVWPARGTITSRFGPRWGGFHNGLDIANRAWTPIVAARSGVVREAGWCRGYGYCVKIRHPGGVETIYGHLVAQPVVAAGDTLTAGQLIGHMGSTYDRAGGGYSTGVHLHFTVIIGGRAVDPLNILP